MRRSSCIIYFLTFVLLLSSTRGYSQTDSFKIYFPLNVRTLTGAEEHKIDSLIYNSLILLSDNVSIVGYADYLANAEYNIKLSQDRAERVKAYLVKSGLIAANIKLCIGKGKIDRAPVNGKLGYPDDRKVVIAIDKKPIPPVTKPNEPVAHVPIKKTVSELKVNETLVMDNIYFLPGRHTIRDDSGPELKKLLDVMNSHPKLKIRIEGHICCFSDPGHEDGYDYDSGRWNLSVGRAKAIYDYLVNNGIDEDRLAYAGFAKRHPLVDPERNEDDQNKNRRVEIRVLSN